MGQPLICFKSVFTALGEGEMTLIPPTWHSINCDHQEPPGPSLVTLDAPYFEETFKSSSHPSLLFAKSFLAQIWFVEGLQGL